MTTTPISLPDGYSFRKLKSSDYENNYLETLKVLTTVGEIKQSEFEELICHWESLPDIYHPRVITNNSGLIVGTGMLFIERKAIHECGKVGHIEDISVFESEQGKKIGNFMVCSLAKIAKEKGCYKVILDCDVKNIGFYEKCGFKNSGIEMVQRFDK
ncbi:unnamed protein product [Candida verbasci]|uniref:Glucosamine 6-phosphate N-acetyltransferase n=1 Tax=Candida verbasci TaxID=1227364 RepID=A0A9W4X8T0_9ASCO|nr:unnamed protein product [Candida verbasci]